MKKKLQAKKILPVIPLAILALGALGVYEYGRAGMERIDALEEENIKAEQALKNAGAQKQEAEEKFSDAQEKLNNTVLREEELRATAAMYREKESSADSEMFLKQKMISSYMENQTLLVAAQSEVLGSIGLDTSFLVSYTQRDIKGDALNMLEDTIIDGLVEEIGAGAAGDVAGATVKEVIHSLSEDFSVDGLCSGISNGLASGVQNVMQSSIQEKINETLGVDIFGIADIANKLTGYEAQVPEYLASKISVQIQNDADALSGYLGQEQLTKTDLENIQTWFSDFGILAEELYEQTNGGVDVRPEQWQTHKENLKEIYKRYCVNEQMIALCERELGVEHEGE